MDSFIIEACKVQTWPSNVELVLCIGNSVCLYTCKIRYDVTYIFECVTTHSSRGFLVTKRCIVTAKEKEKFCLPVFSRIPLTMLSTRLPLFLQYCENMILFGEV